MFTVAVNVIDLPKSDADGDALTAVVVALRVTSNVTSPELGANTAVPL
jgi:hypothetical protein